MPDKIWNPLAIHFAKRSQDSTLDPVKRMAAMLIVGEMAQNGSWVIDAPKEKPEFVWRNGARIRTRS